MSVQAQESPVSWDVEGWVKAALRSWAREDERVQIVAHAAGISIFVDGREIATVTVRVG